MLDPRTFVQNIVNAYREKFHWPYEKEVYYAEVKIWHIVLLIIIGALILMYWKFILHKIHE